MSSLATYSTLAPIFAAALLVLSACTQSAKGGSGPMTFLQSRIAVLNYDLIEVEASILNPVEGALRAYSDCIAARYAHERLNSYLRIVTSKTEGRGDVVVEKTTYLLSPVAPEGEFVLNASQIVGTCNQRNVPTV